MTESAPVVSVVIPVFNNRPAVLRALSGELLEALDKLPNPAEVVFVDDGSGDETKRALAGLVDVDARVRVVELVANFGQHAALSAGFEVVRGRIIVSMDADGQSDPRDIPKLIAPLDNGFDMVSGIRRKRQDPAVRQVLSRMVTWFVARMMRVRLLDIGCPFNAFTADVAKSLGRFGELRRFLKPLAVRLARRVTEVEVTHRARPTEEPKSSYSSNRIVRLLMDFLVNSVGDVFAWLFLCGAGLFAVLTVATIVLAAVAAGGMPVVPYLLAAAGLTIQAGLMALLGLAGDYVQRTYRQSSGQPLYLIRCVHERESAQRGDGRGR